MEIKLKENPIDLSIIFGGSPPSQASSNNQDTSVDSISPRNGLKSLSDELVANKREIPHESSILLDAGLSSSVGNNGFSNNEPDRSKETKPSRLTIILSKLNFMDMSEDKSGRGSNPVSPTSSSNETSPNESGSTLPLLERLGLRRSKYNSLVDPNKTISEEVDILDIFNLSNMSTSFDTEDLNSLRKLFITLEKRWNTNIWGEIFLNEDNSENKSDSDSNDLSDPNDYCTEIDPKYIHISLPGIIENLARAKNPIEFVHTTLHKFMKKIIGITNPYLFRYWFTIIVLASSNDWLLLYQNMISDRRYYKCDDQIMEILFPYINTLKNLIERCNLKLISLSKDAMLVNMCILLGHYVKHFYYNLQIKDQTLFKYRLAITILIMSMFLDIDLMKSNIIDPATGPVYYNILNKSLPEQYDKTSKTFCFYYLSSNFYGFTVKMNDVLYPDRRKGSRIGRHNTDNYIDKAKSGTLSDGDDDDNKAKTPREDNRINSSTNNKKSILRRNVARMDVKDSSEISISKVKFIDK